MFRSIRERDSFWLGVAEALSNGSHCVRSKVGAVIVVGDVETFVGWNDVRGVGVPCDLGGCPRGGKTLEELPSGAPFEGDGYCTAVHAEIMAATYFFRKYKWVANDVLLYTSREPCEKCWEELDRMGFMRDQVIWKRD